MKATITLEDTETGNVTINCAFSEPVTDKTQSVAVLLTMAIMMCACKAGAVNMYQHEGSETPGYAVMNRKTYRKTLYMIDKRIMEFTGKLHGK
ncbi:MAG: hypothetical protein JJE30_06065 [Desulfuromonadales bacterium]|nr:hypothetical protein [Desulfuromonadales bacterium]